MADLSDLLSQYGLQSPSMPVGMDSGMPANKPAGDYLKNMLAMAGSKDNEATLLHRYLFLSLKQAYPHMSDLELLHKAGGMMAQKQINDYSFSNAIAKNNLQMRNQGGY